MSKNELQNLLDSKIREYLEENDLDYLNLEIEVELYGDTTQHKWDEE